MSFDNVMKFNNYNNFNDALEYEKTEKNHNICKYNSLYENDNTYEMNSQKYDNLIDYSINSIDEKLDFISNSCFENSENSIKNNPRQRLLEEIMNDKYDGYELNPEIDKKIECHKQRLNFQSYSSDINVYLFPVAFFSHIDNHKDYVDEFFGMLNDSLNQDFKNEAEFNEFYENFFSFTLLASFSENPFSEVFPKLDKYISANLYSSFESRDYVNSKIAKIFKLDNVSYKIHIAMIDEFLDKY